MRRGAFIVLEGIDRTGKTTQSAKLIDALKSLNIKCEYKRFPDRTTATGIVIDSYLKSSDVRLVDSATLDSGLTLNFSTELRDEVIHLLYSANRWEAIDDLKQKLDSGVNIICDRYAFSGVVFTAAKGLNLDWCKNPDAGLLAPDCVLYLDLTVEQSKLRGDFGDERYEKEDFQRKVRAQYEALYDETWQTVDASQSIDDVHKDLLKLTRTIIDDPARTNSYSTLW